MARKTLPPSGPASPDTIEEHLRVGRRWLSDARRAFPELLPEDALVAMQLKGGPLDQSSIGRYRADLRYALIELMTLSHRMAEFDAAWAKVDAALCARRERKRGRNKTDGVQRRTSAKKVEDATEAEARALFYELKRHAINLGNPNAILAALFVLVAGHGGFRPVELRGARLEGRQLTLINAKKRPGLHEPDRALDLAELHEDVIVGVGLLLDLIDHNLSKREFAKWQKVLAEQMRRACVRIGIRVLSLYSFRHVAIASWSAAGLSPKEIARLCGHISIRTAHTHYARAGVGHKRKAVARAELAPAPAIPHPLPTTNPGLPNPVTAAEAPRDDLGIEDMPVAGRRSVSNTPPMPPDEVRRYFASLIDQRDPEEIARNLRRAQEARTARESRRRGPAGEPDG